ncbi:MAG TPA: tetratricopeptide repeat protein [Gallionellaceae bacterium]
MSYRVKLTSYLVNRDRGWILALLAAVFALYAPFLGSPLIFDDLPFFLGGVAKQYAHSLPNFGLRWLPYATLGWTEMAFSNVVTHVFHLGSLLLHAANVILLFYLLRLLAGSVAPDGKQSSAVIWGAWFGALIFALHPVAVYAVGYVVQRSTVMALFFVLIMQMAYLRGLLSGRWGYLLLAAIAYFLAVFSKEHSVLAPLLLAAETVLLRGQIRAGKRGLWLMWAALFLIALAIVLIARGTFGTPYEAMAADLFKQEGVAESTPALHLLSILTQMGLFFKYLLLWILPNPAWMSIDMREPFVASLTDWRGWLGATGFLLYGYAGVRLLLRRGRLGLLGLAMLYPWLQFVLEFSTIRVQEPFVLYRSYLWMPGLMLLFPWLAEKWRGKLVWLAGGVLAVLLGAAAAERLWVMADPYRLWNDAALLLPGEKVAGADRIYFNRGQILGGRGKLDDAIADFRRSLAVSNQYAPVHFELGWALARLNRFDEAMVEFDQSIALDPKFPNAYFGKGLLLKMRGKPVEAAQLMAKACELKHAMACLISRGYIENENKQ